MVYISIVVFCLISLLFNKLIYGNLKNLPSLITIIWCVTLFLAMLGLYGVYVPDNVVVLYALIFVASFNFFSFLFKTFKNVKNQVDTLKDMYIDDKVLVRIITVCTILLMITCHNSFNVFTQTHSFSAVRNAFINYESIGVHMQVLVMSLIIPVGKSVYILSAIEYIYNRKLKKSLIMSIFFILLVTFLTAGRSNLLVLILVFLVALFNKDFNIFRIIKKNKKIVRICIASVIILFIITAKRGFGESSVFTSIYVYFAGCFNLFGVYLNKGMVFEPTRLYGQSLISGFAFPILELLRYVFKINILPGNYILDAEATSKYISISRNISISASPTTMFFAIRDFGIMGLIIYPMVISYVYQRLKKKRNDKFNLLNEGKLVYFIATACFLNMSYQFAAFKYVSVFIYMSIIYKFATKRRS